MSRNTIAGLEAEIRKLYITIEEQRKLLDAAAKEERTMLQDKNSVLALYEQELKKSNKFAYSLTVLEKILANQAQALANISRKN
jgi:hypothetical protein